jgi:hypothetical protein
MHDQRNQQLSEQLGLKKHDKVITTTTQHIKQQEKKHKIGLMTIIRTVEGSRFHPTNTKRVNHKKKPYD